MITTPTIAPTNTPRLPPIVAAATDTPMVAPTDAADDNKSVDKTNQEKEEEKEEEKVEKKRPPLHLQDDIPQKPKKMKPSGDSLRVNYSYVPMRLVVSIASIPLRVRNLVTPQSF